MAVAVEVARLAGTANIGTEGRTQCAVFIDTGSVNAPIFGQTEPVVINTAVAGSRIRVARLALWDFTC